MVLCKNTGGKCFPMRDRAGQIQRMGWNSSVRSFLYLKPRRTVTCLPTAEAGPGGSLGSLPALSSATVWCHLTPPQHSCSYTPWEKAWGRDPPMGRGREAGATSLAGSPESLFCLTFLTKGSPARTWAWPQRGKFWRRQLYNLGRWGYSEGPGGDLGIRGGHEGRKLGWHIWWFHRVAQGCGWQMVCQIGSSELMAHSVACPRNMQGTDFSGSSWRHCLSSQTWF